jgi:photosystem II stability/assembly factor-like uncharacterized protein
MRRSPTRASIWGLYKTTDAGRSWRVALDRRHGTIGVTAIGIDPARPRTVYIGVHGTENGVLKTVDGGLTWELVGHDVHYPGAFAFAFDPRDSDVVYAGTDNGLFRTRDGGRTWALLGTDGSVSEPARSARLPSALETRRSCTWGRLRACSRSGTPAAGGRRQRRSARQGGHRVGARPVAPATLYVGVFDLGLLKSTDGARTWRPFSPPREYPGWGWVAASSIVVDSRDHRTVYMGGSRGVLVGRDPGESWSRLAAGLGSSRGKGWWDVSGLDVDTTGRVLYASTSCCGVYRLAR